jgi:hypothetical protein
MNTTKTLHDMTTEFQTRLQNGIFTGTKLQRKKNAINDGIAGLLNINPPVFTCDKTENGVIEAICRLTGESGHQWILYDKSAGTIDMYPTGISQWSAEIPTVIGSKDGTWIYTGKIANLAEWIKNREYQTELPAPSSSSSGKDEHSKPITFPCFENDEYINTKTKVELIQGFESLNTAHEPYEAYEPPCLTKKELEQKKKDELIVMLTRLKFMAIASKIRIGMGN